MKLRLYLHALRAARSRQLRARVLRPLRRRRFPAGPTPRFAHPVPQVLELSPTFEAVNIGEPVTRLARFRLTYGEDVLAAARAGDATLAARQLEDWIRAHPPRNDDAWHPYPVSTRIGNWIAALTLLPELASRSVSDSLWLHLQRLEANVEDDVLGNHVIRNARSLVLGGAAFDAPRLTERGLDLLHRELGEQVLSDGGHYERSPVYHLGVLRDVLEVQAVSPHPWIGDVIERMRAFAAALQRPDGQPALFNDGGLEQAPALDLPQPTPGLSVFPETGFAAVREGSLWLAFRCGPLAPDFLPAHAHADALSFQLWFDGRPVIADAGTYTYEPGSERNWFRGTAAHSTVRVDGRDQFELWRSFRSGPLPQVELHEARQGLLEASVRLRGGIRHVRRLEWVDKEVSVRDRVEGSGTHRLESRLLWAPEVDECIELSVGRGRTHRRERAWVSERFGERVETQQSLVAVDARLPAELSLTIASKGIHNVSL